MYSISGVTEIVTLFWDRTVWYLLLQTFVRAFYLQVETRNISQMIWSTRATSRAPNKVRKDGEMDVLGKWRITEQRKDLRFLRNMTNVIDPGRH